MDYRDFVRKHKESNAAITIAALPCAEKEASAFGLMKIDKDGVVTEFAEKPKGDALKSMQVRGRGGFVHVGLGVGAYKQE